MQGLGTISDAEIEFGSGVEVILQPISPVHLFPPSLTCFLVHVSLAHLLSLYLSLSLLSVSHFSPKRAYAHSWQGLGTIGMLDGT